MADGSVGIVFDPESKASKLAIEGSKYHTGGNYDAARMCYDAALLLDPAHPIALQNLCGILFSSNQYKAALSIGRRAVMAAPGNPGALSNYSASLMHLGQYQRAIEHMKKVLEAVPNDAGVWHNFALCQYMLGRINSAIDAIEKSLTIDPESKMRQSDRGLFVMASGQLQKGLEIYESRWYSIYQCEAHKFFREWHGQDLSGKSLLLCHEQGFGDGIMLIRFVNDLAELGANITVAVPPELKRLFELNFPEKIIDWKSTDWSKEDFDFQVPMLTALRYLGVTPKTIKSRPYINVPKWTETSLGPDGYRIGICWESGDHSPILRTRRRVIPLEYFFPLAELSNVRLVSLQKGAAEKDILATGAESFVFNSMSRVEDFYDTARIISCLDLVIAVDSAVAHLAGAMGKPVIMLGPFTRCWRWWGETNGKPWYDKFQIIPQEPFGNWLPAMKRVVNSVSLRLEAPRHAA